MTDNNTTQTTIPKPQNPKTPSHLTIYNLIKKHGSYDFLSP
jgi:hypothetical protein